MRKAFDANVPKLKPRLRGVGAPPTESPIESRGVSLPSPAREERAVPAAAGPSTTVQPPVPVPSPGSPTTRSVVAPPATTRAERGARVEGGGVESRGTVAATSAVQVPAEASAGPLFDVTERRDRLEKIKRKVAAAARAPTRLDAPAEPARAGESALALVRDLEAQLARSREMEDSLRADLSQARGELARAAAESRGAGERLAAAEKALAEKQAVLAEMLPEMNALEEERDEALRRAQALAALDEERQKLLDEVTRRAEESEKALSETRAEGERLSSELDARAADEARLRSGLTEVARERDALARELGETRSERDKLLEARRALEQVHQALSQARARHG